MDARAATEMTFGFNLTGLSPRHYAAVSVEAEAAGFESVWLPDHLVLPAKVIDDYPYSEDGTALFDPSMAVYDPWVLLGAIASVTSTIRLGTSVYVLPLRHPIVTARAVLTVDRISRGRVTLGAGVGWLTEEFSLVGETAGDRGRRTDEIIPLLRRLWSEEIIEHHGTYYDLEPVRFEPKPFQSPIPIEIGGTSKAALQRAGALGDGWIEIGAVTEEDFAAKLAVVREARRRADRDALPFTVTLSGPLADGGLDGVRRAADLGVGRIMIRPDVSIAGHNSREDYSGTVARFADEVISQL